MMSVASDEIPNTSSAMGLGSDVLSATRTIGGQHGYVTKLLQELNGILDLDDYSRASDVLDLQARVKTAHHKYSDSIKSFCDTLQDNSKRKREYDSQLDIRNRDLQTVDERVNKFLLEGLATGSVVTSRKSGSRRSKKNSNASILSGTSLSSSARARMEMKIAEVNLETARREKSLVTKALESEHVIIQAESVLAKAKIRSEAALGILDLEGEEPPLSSFDKVDQYVNGLPISQSDNNPKPEVSQEYYGLNSNIRADLSQERCDVPSSSHLVAQDVVTAGLQQALNPCILPDYTMQSAHGDVLFSQAPGPCTPDPIGFPEGYGSIPRDYELTDSVIISSQPLGPTSTTTCSLIPSTNLPQADMFNELTLNGDPAFSHAVSHEPAVSASSSLQTIGSGSRETGPQATFSLLNHSYEPALSIGDASNFHRVFGSQASRVLEPPSQAKVLFSEANTAPPIPFGRSGLHGPAIHVSARSAIPPSSRISTMMPSSCNSNQRFHHAVPGPIGSHPKGSRSTSAPSMLNRPAPVQSSVDDLAQVLVRCQRSQPLNESERYSGDPLQYHQFIRQIEDRVLKYFQQSDPGHAFQLLLDSTAGRARKLIGGCIMLKPAKALEEALRLLYKTFGSPSVAIKAHLKIVCEGPTIQTDERGLQEFYSDLINCKMVVESAKATYLLDAMSTSEGIFARFPRHLQEKFSELALRRGYDMDYVPFDLFIEFIDHSQRLASSRLGRLMRTSKEKTSPKNSKPFQRRIMRAHVAQVDNANGQESANTTRPKPSNNKEETDESKPSLQCSACGATDHKIWKCQRFSKNSLQDRVLVVKQKRLCYNCLAQGHKLNGCPSKVRCRECHKKHHTLLHSSLDPGATSSNITSDNPETIQNACTSHEKGKRIRLQVLPVSISNPDTGATRSTWALLDTGSNTHLLTKDLCESLRLSGRSLRSKLQLADGEVKPFHTQETICVVEDMDGVGSFLLEGMRVVDRLPDLSDSIPSAADLTSHEHLSGIKIPIIGEDKVELLIGTGAPELHVFSEIRKGDSTKPWAGKTPLGWVLFGCDQDRPDETQINHVNLIRTCSLDMISEQICPCQFEHSELFTDSDACLPSIDDEKALCSMQNSCKLVNGHYSMRLPWKDGCPRLPNNYHLALSRLKGLGRRLKREPETLALYREKVNDMIQLGHAFRVCQTDHDIDGRVWYIPHHCTGKKFRVVFDCAANCNGTSINQQLLQGPDNTSTLIGVLLRFRLYPVALVGDIKSMFHQVSVHEADQSALRFLWWRDGDPDQPVEIYQLTVHTFGLTSSPSIAGYALRRTAVQNVPNVSELAVTTVKTQFYVDDLLVSLQTCNQAVQLMKELDILLGSGGFKLTKYVSNCPEVLATLPTDQLTPQLQDVDLHNEEFPSHKTLGLIWHPSTDQFCVKVAIADHPLTRRGLLSVVASVYDPLGIVGPYTLPAKLLLQQLAKQDHGWDVEIPEDAKIAWNVWLNALPKLDGLSIPRVYTGFETARSVQLHVFADASKNGYGAVCYLRSDNGEECSCTFVIGKSRVAPMKQQSIPRLELCAAVTAVRLSQIILREHHCNVDKLYFWTDSTTVLTYVRDTSKRRPAFEKNRISTIHKYSNVEQWHWVGTQQNPADLYSRGVSPRHLYKAEKWLKAPEFLLKNEPLWPLSNFNPESVPESAAVIDEEDASKRQGSQSLALTAQISPTMDSEHVPTVLVRLTTKFSALRRAVKSTVWLLRSKQFLLKRLKDKTVPPPVNDSIGAKEFDNALLALIRIVQQQEFPSLVEALEQFSYHEVVNGEAGKTPKASMLPLIKYCPFVEDGVIRIGGRLQRSKFSKDFKHPIVLPKIHHFTGLIILYHHSEMGHNSTNYVLNYLRSRYHVVGQGRTVKRYIKQMCMVCRYRDASLGSQLMAPLPPARVEAGQGAFNSCGIDYMGPLVVKQGRSSLKRYCCVFTCLASRATHLEMAYDLSTESFLMALRRFLSTRGHSTKTIYSDNGTNFVGAKSELQRGIQRLNQSQIKNELSPKGVEWKHAPPLASHQGGIYEAIIRLVRKAMDSLMADRKLRSLTDEGLMTLLKEIEYILNCRPLTAVSSNPDDLETLSPIMLLTTSMSPGLPPDVFVGSDGMRSSWRACQLQTDEFWKRWQSEYLQLLQRRQKWLTPQRNFKRDDLVLLLDEDQPRNMWPKGLVVEVFPDRDGLVRRVKVRVASGKVFMRDIRKLCLLESEIDELSASDSSNNSNHSGASNEH